MVGLPKQAHFLGAKLKNLRKRHGLTLDELSARCVQLDVEAAPSTSYLSMMENGKRSPSSEVLALLAKVFGKGTGFAIGLIFLTPIFALILGFGSDTYKGTANAA